MRVGERETVEERTGTDDPVVLERRGRGAVELDPEGGKREEEAERWRGLVRAPVGIRRTGEEVGEGMARELVTGCPGALTTGAPFRGGVEGEPFEYAATPFW